MRKRFLLAFPAVLMHLFFGLCCALAWVLVWPAIIYYVITGNDNIRDRIYGFGKAEDQATNAALFNGLPQETVSSHVGRIFQKRIAQDYDPPKWARAIKWITDLFEFEHVLQSVEEPFEGERL